MEELIQTMKRLHDVHCLVGSGSCSKREDGGDTNNAVDYPMPLENWLPRVVVIGPQSSGKSSIIEGLVRRSFLPKGTGTITRRPLVLQLIFCTKKEISRMATETANPNLEAWGVFQHKPDQRFLKFDDIRKEIQVETSRITGDNYGISSEPMFLTIYSSSMNLTLVDLPGLVEMPVGDQPPDIVQKVRNMILRYISVPHSIILTVVPANTDFTTSESLKLARQVDPEGLRTLMVVTKLDLMDAGTDATALLTGRMLHMRLGIVGVVNMSQKHIQQGMSIYHAIDQEQTFLKTFYPKIASKHGISNLSKILQNLLLNHIKRTSPDLRRKVMKNIDRLKIILDSYGSPIMEKGQTLLQLINEFSSTYCSSIMGNFHDIDTSELCCGARIAYIFQESFGGALDSIDPLAGLSRGAMLTAMRNASGTRPGLFVPEVSFELLVKKQIEKLEDPSIRCADLVHEELENLVKVRAKKCSPLLRRFPVLHRRLTDACLDIVKSQLSVTHAMIRQIVAIQLAYINTSHPDFVKEAHEIQYWDRPGTVRQESTSSLDESCCNPQDTVSTGARYPNASRRSYSQESLLVKGSALKIKGDSRGYVDFSPLDKENRDSLVIEHLIKTYFNIVRKSIQDNVPKTIMHCLVNYVTENLQQQLVCQLYHPDLIDELLTESDEVCRFRKNIEEKMLCLKKAADILYDLRDTRAPWPGWTSSKTLDR